MASISQSSDKQKKHHKRKDRNAVKREHDVVEVVTPSPKKQRTAKEVKFEEEEADATPISMSSLSDSKVFLHISKLET